MICDITTCKSVITMCQGYSTTTTDERWLPQLEWYIHPRIFWFIDQMRGKHTIDRFANQLPTYNSRFWDPWTHGVDALAQSDWKVHNNYINCPFNMLPKVLAKIQQTKSMATVIAPWWPGKPWCQTLRRLAVDQPWQLPKRKGVIWSGGACPEPLRNTKWRIYAWRISGMIN